MPALKAGTVYFMLVFAVGFVLGTIRVLAVVPAVGETIAVLIETPVMATISWIACRFIIRRFDVPAVLADRVTMGASAFALLMVAEIGVAWLLGQRSLSGYFVHYATVAGVIGLAGQIAFAVFPALQLRFPEKAGS
jgi:hypothetical protein